MKTKIDMKLISAAELHTKIHNNENLLLIDVRTDLERFHFNIGGIHLPLEEVLQNINSIDLNKEVVFYCEKGIRSFIAIQRLEAKLGKEHLINLQGGMEAWKKHFNNNE